MYEVTKREYEQMEEEIGKLRDERLAALTPAGEGITVFNTTGFARNDVVELGECTAAALSDGEGHVYPVCSRRKTARCPM